MDQDDQQSGAEDFLRGITSINLSPEQGASNHLIELNSIAKWTSADQVILVSIDFS